MQELKYQVSFITPAFLGGADQSAQWRTPPFKALLRQWWRVVYAADRDFRVDVGALRREEGLLFGNAWLYHREGNREVGDSSKSLVRIRLDRWNEGAETKARWGKQELEKNWKVRHREVGQIGPLLYLGYGPLEVEKVQPRLEYATVLKNNAAIQAGDRATLSIAVPDEHAQRVGHTLWLMDLYGTIGGRSRNGWGSFSLRPLNEGSRKALEGHPVPLHDLHRALEIEWPHAIGQDAKGALVWQTAAAYDDWKQMMRELAVVKIGLRTQFGFTLNPAAGDRQTQRGINHGRPQDRHWLSFPVTNHPVSQWGGNARLPNSLRFKVRPDKSDPKKLRGIIFHVPCLPPPDFRPVRKAIESVWQRVHASFDAPAQRLQRIPE